MTPSVPATRVSPWPHRWAVLLVCATFPLLMVGGMVTTTDAGMAVPDWPTTFGWVFYPLPMWFRAPWDLFVEHGHRMFGQLVGIITIGFVVSVYRCDERRWLRRYALFLLGLVCLQGIFGGLRVVLGQWRLGLLHGCTGPLFFCCAVGAAWFSSRRWREGRMWIEEDDANVATRRALLGRLQRFSAVTFGAAYLQLVLGAMLRHLPPMTSPQVYPVVVMFHLVFAAVVTGHIVWLAALAWRHRKEFSEIYRPAMLALAAIGFQLLLGLGAWIARFGWPQWLRELGLTPGYTIQAQGLSESMIITAHVATGSLILALTALVVLRIARLGRRSPTLERAKGSVQPNSPTLFVGLLARGTR